MAASSTYNQYGGIQQDLLKVLTVVAKYRTPFYDRIGKKSAKDRIHNWTVTQITGSGTAQNAQVENYTIVTNAAQPYLQFFNYTQIIAWPFNVSRTQTRVDYAGVPNYIASQTKIAMQNVVMDLENALLNATGTIGQWVFPQYSGGGSGSSAAGRVMTGLVGFATGYTATGSSTAFNTSAGLQIMEPFLNGIWSNGALCTPDFCLVNMAQKQGIDSWSTPVTRWIDAEEHKLAYMINVYQGSFTSPGGLQIMIDQYVPANTVFAGNGDGLATAFLDKPFVKEIAQTTDGLQFQVALEATFEALNPYGLGTLTLA